MEPVPKRRGWFRQRSMVIPTLNARLSLDLEVGKYDACIHALAAVRTDTHERLTFPEGGMGLESALNRLDKLADATISCSATTWSLSTCRTSRPQNLTCPC